MKNRLLLFASACVMLGGCNNSPDKNSANDKNAVSAAMAHRDSLLNAANKNRTQDSINGAKGTDTTHKNNPKKGNVD